MSHIPCEEVSSLQTGSINKCLCIILLTNNGCLLAGAGKRTTSGKQPTHRRSRHVKRAISNVCTRSCFVNVNEKTKSRISSTNGKNTWVNELRGGYMRNYFNFSKQERNETKYQSKREKWIDQTGWNSEIRLNERTLSTKVVPNFELLKKFESSSHDVDIDTNEGFFPAFFSKKGDKISPLKKCTNYSKTEEAQFRKQNLEDSIRERNKKGNSRNIPYHIATPTICNSAKREYDVQRKLAEEKNSLHNLIKLCSFSYPLPTPKIITIKNDNSSLEEIEKELLSLPRSLNNINLKFNKIGKGKHYDLIQTIKNKPLNPVNAAAKNTILKNYCTLNNSKLRNT
ncbi:conserved Plasmodium protein, unknown function [Plasmodium ovale curtisi]|uniref:Uncharacterized protein n=1 Tax=Plasmodium ovale curtisi TaxID=864141 RepID=A0A1A8W436_PLAOA|nr:conserved Plasmodium protein, unknown function [Plasmodium ovale curtisi]